MYIILINKLSLKQKTGENMRVLLIHSDYIKYQVKNKTPVAEEIEEAQKNGAFDEALVVFSSIEKEDEENPSAIVKNLVA